MESDQEHDGMPDTEIPEEIERQIEAHCLAHEAAGEIMREFYKRCGPKQVAYVRDILRHGLWGGKTPLATRMDFLKLMIGNEMEWRCKRGISTYPNDMLKVGKVRKAWISYRRQFERERDNELREEIKKKSWNMAVPIDSGWYLVAGQIVDNNGGLEECKADPKVTRLFHGR